MRNTYSLRAMLSCSAALAVVVALLTSHAAAAASRSDNPINVFITSPSAGQTVSGLVNVSAETSNGNATAMVFLVDGAVRGRDDSAPFAFSWSTTGDANGRHSVTARGTSASGRVGEASITVNVSNQLAGDSTIPTTPQALAVTATTSTAITVAWSPSTDNVGVTGYSVFRSGANVGSTAGTTWSFGTLNCGTTYTLGVEAYDAAGNRSQRASLNATTSACSSQPPSACVSGECLPVGDLPGWRQVFVDDFGSSVPLGGFSGCVASSRQCSGLPADVRAKWFAYPDGWKDSYVGTYMPSRVMSVQGGLMNLYLHSENGSRLVAAPEPIVAGSVGPEGGQLYGRYAIRFRADQLAGYKTSWMLWPDSEVWPRDGEIDFPEGDLAGTQWSTMYGFVHHQGATSSSDQDWFNSGVAYGDWHTAVIEWLPGRVSFSLDGRLVGTTTTAVPDTPMHLVLQTPTTDSFLAALGTAGNVQIDWIAIWTPS